MDFGINMRKEKDRDGKKMTVIGYTKGEFCGNCRNLYSDSGKYRCPYVPKRNIRDTMLACIYFFKKVEYDIK